MSSALNGDLFCSSLWSIAFSSTRTRTGLSLSFSGCLISGRPLRPHSSTKCTRNSASKTNQGDFASYASVHCSNLRQRTSTISRQLFPPCEQNSQKRSVSTGQSFFASMAKNRLSGNSNCMWPRPFRVAPLLIVYSPRFRTSFCLK